MGNANSSLAVMRAILQGHVPADRQPLHAGPSATRRAGSQDSRHCLMSGPTLLVPSRPCTPSLFHTTSHSQRSTLPVGQLIKEGLQGLPPGNRLRLTLPLQGTQLIPGPGTKILPAMQHSVKRQDPNSRHHQRAWALFLRHQTSWGL